ncbi:helix-turn-helix domain-containing protein [Umezawaea tangerina]|uniref:Transcriptional regulator with AbiEi antitoxin domain of type IV toxin-antitoxin system n=1 Tax=Umezawaea tangerina TaxID=84725 RepID=A0A2T0T9M5_9PSEU|nr:helix-turn-helix domain-containing protein [Umezawaea tangerina]PRY42363.1 transcriptional regulator with AbiEi antitoxin domain of type IV toxin-antitoxin system [Umezawaea tangerina]
MDATDSLLEQALDQLRSLLGTGWTVLPLPNEGQDHASDSAIDAAVRISPPDGASPYTEILVAARQNVVPRDVDTEFRAMRNIMRHSDNRQTLLVVSPWLSPRTRQQLSDHDVAYLDLTGNASLSITYPSVRIHTHGAAKAPGSLLKEADTGRTVGLGGARAARVVRFLADFTPPYQAKNIADATGVSLAWVSRLLGQLEDQLLIRRDGRTITAVKWPELLEARAESYDLLRRNPHVNAVALNGARSVLDDLRDVLHRGEALPRIAVTGTYAARRIAPFAVGGQLLLYVDDEPTAPHRWIDALNLLPDEEAGDVLLLRAHDPVVFERTTTVEDIPYVAPTQVVLDGLSGPGRMPAEARQVLKYLTDNDSRWRRPWSPDRV